MTTVISAILVFFVLILFHELGHFLVAKSVGIKVDEFAIGMGPTILKKIKGETKYSLKLLPIGGYCKMDGEDECSSDPRAYSNKPVWARMLVVLAGAVTNILFAYIIFVVLSVNRQDIPLPIVESVVPESNAVGLLEPGDRIIKANNQSIHIYDDLSYFMYRNGGNVMELTLLRNGEKVKVELTPTLRVPNSPAQGYMIGFNRASRSSNTFIQTARDSFYQSIFICKAILLSLGDLITGREGLEQMSGPVGIIKEIGGAAEKGITDLFMLMALISLNLGVFNLLPIPALDGSRVAFMLVELVRKKPMKPEHEGIIHLVGFAFLILLIIFVSYNDVVKIINKT